jgi:predicted TIM-barrel fold metal-dependent hydrolase
MADFKLISADSHLNEPPAAWERVQREYGERAPRVVKDPPGVPAGTWLITDGLPPMGVSHFSIGLVADKPQGISAMDLSKWQETIDFNAEYSFEKYPAGWEPSARLAAQDRDGVEAEVLFASPGRFFYGLTDAKFQRAILRSYNAWLHEFCSYAPKRLIALPLVSILDVPAAVDDICEYAKLGFKGVQIPTGIKDSGYYEPQYEPLWAAAEETGMVLNVHTTSTQGEQRKHFEGPRQQDPRTQSMGQATRQSHAERFIGHLAFSGVFDRHPNLKVVCAEFDVGWVSYIYQQVDYLYSRQSTYDADRNVYQRLPSEYLEQNVFFTFQDDRAGVLTTPVYGEDNFLWASDFPHGVTTWPYSHRTVDRNFQGIDPAVKRKICRRNAIRLYGLELEP